MQSYSEKDRIEIAKIAPVGSRARVNTLRHTYGDNYKVTNTTYFPSLETAMESTDGSEVRLPDDWFGDMAFSIDGKTIYLVTTF